MQKIKPFKKILVANRGEIAIRIFRAASELNIRTVAVYTYEDRYSLHRYKADESYQIGENEEALKPYLDIEEILRIACEQGVDAIHPGYGFLSENVEFARRCAEEGIAFVGPEPEAMQQVGNKVACKALAKRIGLPLIEGSKRPLTSLPIALEEAKRIGYPLMVKAASGGGGRGMRVVRSAGQLETAFNAARNEARTAFGDDTLFLEKFVESPRHIEVQVLGDKYGNLIHLFERDCSVQRRFQKVVEIAPAPQLQQNTRQKLYDYALQLLKAVNYSSAGTVEFLVDADERIYFIEVNPRIQVEHTVTEEVTGIDLVRAQFLIAMGHPLSDSKLRLASQADVHLAGCAIQCRITTEDPTNDFQPDYGTLIAYRSASGFGIRLDAGNAHTGAVISPYFDSLLVKVTAWGRTLAGAAARMHRALREFRVRGVKTNIGFLLNLLEHDTFLNGKATVNFIKDHPELMHMPRFRNRSTKLIRYLAEVIVNGHPDVKYVDEERNKQFQKAIPPGYPQEKNLPKGIALSGEGKEHSLPKGTVLSGEGKEHSLPKGAVLSLPGHETGLPKGAALSGEGKEHSLPKGAVLSLPKGDALSSEGKEHSLPKGDALSLPGHETGLPKGAALSLPKGSRNTFLEKGAEGLISWLKKQKSIQYTDTTLRDAHQSLLATRMRTYDMLQMAEQYALHHGAEVFSMEVWGGATFDVALRFLKENPWQRLELLRQAIPNVLFQMLLRGSNAVGYAAYPDNLVERFIEKAFETGIDIFRIFDSLNWVENMRVSIRKVRETGAIAEACICYTGDVSDPTRSKYSLSYYLDLARRLEDEGAHILAIKDMAGLLKPRAAEILIPALKEKVDIPIHLHTHDTSSIQAATYMKAIEAGVDVIDVALASMSGLTSQPNFNSIVAMMQGHEREQKINLQMLNNFSNYFETVRNYYYPFETDLHAGTAEVYEHEIPGGQYSNLRPQARALGLEDQFDLIKTNYKIANELLGDLVKVTPSSKVVGDLAMFMTANKLTKEDILGPEGKKLDFPESLKALLRGDLGQTPGGFPKHLSRIVLKGEKPYTDRPNAHLQPISFEQEIPAFFKKFGTHYDERDFLSYKLYPKVFLDWHKHRERFGQMHFIPTPAFFFGLSPNEEILVTLERGKTVILRYLHMTEPDEKGFREVFFTLNGQTRAVKIADQSVNITLKKHRKAEKENEIGAPLQGKLARILVEPGDEVDVNTPLFVIEAMKMESTVTSSAKGRVKAIHLPEKTLVEQGDLVVELVKLQ